MWAPVLKIYHYNVDQIRLGLLDLAVICGLVALAFSLIVSPLFGNKTAKSFLLASALGLATVAITNTYLVPAPASVLDGESYETASVDHIRIGLVIVTMSLALALWLLRYHLPGAANVLSRLAFGFVLLYTIMFSVFTAGKAPGLSTLVARVLSPGDWHWSLSKKKNILVLSFDGMQGSVASGLLRRNPTLAAKFDGFENFSDASAVYPNTDYSLASVLTGRLPRNKADNLTSAMSGENFVKASSRSGSSGAFAAGFYVCEFCVPKGPPEFEFERSANEFAMLLALGVNVAYGGGEKLVAYAMAPLVGQVLPPTIQSHTWKLDINAFRGAIGAIQVTRDEPVVQYRHYYATHQPNIYDSDCKLRSNPNADLSLDAVEREVHCALDSVGLLIDRLKAEGIYNQTMIFVISDHGYGPPVNNLKSDPLARELLFRGSDIKGPENLKVAGAYSASLLFKDFQRHGPLKTNPAPASLLDVTATVCDEINSCNLDLEGQSLRKEISPDRERRYWRYFGGSTYSEGWEKRFYDGLDEWFEVRKFRGSLETGLVPSIEMPVAKHGPR